VEPGDVVIVLQQQKHQVFQRHNCDLMMTREISLTEALCGLVFIVRHLDGRNLVIQSPPGMVIEPGNNCWLANISCNMLASFCIFSSVVVLNGLLLTVQFANENLTFRTVCLY